MCFADRRLLCCSGAHVSVAAECENDVTCCRSVGLGADVLLEDVRVALHVLSVSKSYEKDVTCCRCQYSVGESVYEVAVLLKDIKVLHVPSVG